jgi:D-sedoheptulose 7-phosphate isomerase
MSDLTNIAANYISESVSAQQSMDMKVIEQALCRLLKARAAGRIIYIVGNGGSAATASHAAVDFLKTSSQEHNVPVLAIAITDHVPILTAIANDLDYNSALSEQIGWFGQADDILLAISVSGNSKNILSAVNTAISAGMTVIALCGFGGGELEKKAHIPIIVNSLEYGPVEDAHMMIIHLFTRVLRMTDPASSNEQSF